ncbi:hypothetical protein B0F90DRAFT_1912230 [Multifurca ochricompacta]|uniref:Malate dehydrogenase n=1 Tax=Multifurca ochricompacta TaxID=376703 RepID=A0AAD4M2P6_9AGAM|nr:hypothetical protein B0F90DRAFT_1912230 [Multifurca ochricompacta]
MLVLSFLSSLLATQAFYAPSHNKHIYVALGVGVQNYTWVLSSSIGAVAELFDISCLYKSSEFSKIQDDAFKILSQSPNNNPSESTLISRLHHNWGLDVLGQHYFIVNPAGGLSPKFDFTSSGSTAGNSNAFVVTAKVGDIPALTGHQDVDWLRPNGVSGKLASQVFRVFTKAGEPPASCSPGSPPISVKYTAQYWFYGSSL